jgi:hypothetical protein
MLLLCPNVPNTCVNLFSLFLVIDEPLGSTKEYWMKMSVLHSNYSITFVCWVGPRINQVLFGIILWLFSQRSIVGIDPGLNTQVKLCTDIIRIK